MKTPHVHADIIKAWADGEQIEFFESFSQQWKPIGSEPCWFPSILFRIKPEPKPDLVYYGAFDEAHVATGNMMINSWFTRCEEQGDHIKVTFDGETGKLKAVEIL